MVLSIFAISHANLYKKLHRVSAPLAAGLYCWCLAGTLFNPLLPLSSYISFQQRTDSSTNSHFNTLILSGRMPLYFISCANLKYLALLYWCAVTVFCLSLMCQIGKFRSGYTAWCYCSCKQEIESTASRAVWHCVKPWC